MLNNVFPLWSLMLIIGALMATAVWFTSKNDTAPVYHGVSSTVREIKILVTRTMHLASYELHRFTNQSSLP